MKQVKIRVALTKTGNKVKYNYPTGYNPETVGVLAYEKDAAGNMKVDGDEILMLATVPDGDEILNAEEVVEVDDTELITLGEAWEPVREVEQDPVKVRRILAKQSSGATLTKEEANAVDPDSAEIGITRSESFTDKVVKLEKDPVKIKAKQDIKKALK